MPSLPDLAPSLVSVVGVIGAALLAALFALRRERYGRRQQRQVEVLYELQEACLAHRQAWQDFAEMQAAGVPVAVVRAADRTGQRLDLVEARVRSDTALAAARAWRALAKGALLQDDRHPASTQDEEQAWQALNAAVRQALRDLG